MSTRSNARQSTTILRQALSERFLAAFRSQRQRGAKSRFFAAEAGLISPKPVYWDAVLSTAAFISRLAMIGYDVLISVEREDDLMPVEDSLKNVAAFLNQILIHEKLSKMRWA